MKGIVVGLGVQGTKRLRVAGDDIVATVDPVRADAHCREIADVPLSSFDFALVCTPDDPKFAILDYLLRNGKHVLVEKPLLTPSEDGLRHLVRTAAENRSVCYTAYNHRFEPHLVSVKQAVQSGRLGALHYLHLFYGNGTARDVRNSVWRDSGLGVLSDIGSHLLDLVDFLLGEKRSDFCTTAARGLENRAFDYVAFRADQRIPVIRCETTLLSWRNTFNLDLVGEKGSVHVECLCKWGPSILTVRERTLPSGRPKEERTVLELADPTWAIEYQHFRELCAAAVPVSNTANDIWIQETLRKMGEQAQRELSRTES